MTSCCLERGRIDLINKRTETLFQWSRDQLIGEPDGRLQGGESNLLAAWIFDKNLPSGADLPSKFKRPVTYNSVPASQRAGAALLSEKRDSVFDAKLLPLPYMQAEWTLPFKTG
jgi:hypothetical protein